MSLRLVTPASALAVTLAEAKAHLRVDGTDEDSLITALIAAATETAEQITGRAIMLQTWEIAIDAFPESIDITRVPLSSVTSVTYTDAAGASQTLTSGTHYRIRTIDDFSFSSIVPAYGYTWPTTRSDTDVVVVRFVAGYANAAAVPQPIKNWILLAIGDMYARRERSSTGTERSQSAPLQFADGLLDRYKVWSL